MNKEKLFSLMPKLVIVESEVESTIKVQNEIAEAGKSFASQLSLNRFMDTKLADLDIESRLHLFEYLNDLGFLIDENQIRETDMTIDAFDELLKIGFQLEDMYKLDNFYLDNLLQGRDITIEAVADNEEGEDYYFSNVLPDFVFHTNEMSIGDTPNLSLMFTVMKALIGSYLAEKNVESLLNGNMEIYDFSILM